MYAEKLLAFEIVFLLSDLFLFVVTVVLLRCLPGFRRSFTQVNSLLSPLDASNFNCPYKKISFYLVIYSQ